MIFKIVFFLQDCFSFLSPNLQSLLCHRKVHIKFLMDLIVYNSRCEMKDINNRN